MLTRFRDQAITVSKAAKLSAEELAGRITIGVLADRDLPISTEEYDKVRQRASEEGMLR